MVVLRLLSWLLFLALALGGAAVSMSLTEQLRVAFRDRSY